MSNLSVHPSVSHTLTPAFDSLFMEGGRGRQARSVTPHASSRAPASKRRVTPSPQRDLRREFSQRSLKGSPRSTTSLSEALDGLLQDLDGERERNASIKYDEGSGALVSTMEPARKGGGYPKAKAEKSAEEVRKTRTVPPLESEIAEPVARKSTVDVAESRMSSKMSSCEPSLEYKDHQARVENYYNEVMKVRTECKQLEEDKAQMMSNMAEYRQQCERKMAEERAEMAKSSAELREKMEEEQAQAQKEIDETRKHCNSVAEERTILASEMAELRAEITKKAVAFGTEQREKCAAQTALSELRAERDKMAEANKTLARSRAELESKMYCERREMVQKIDALTSQMVNSCTSSEQKTVDEKDGMAKEFASRLMQLAHPTRTRVRTVRSRNASSACERKMQGSADLMVVEALEKDEATKQGAKAGDPITPRKQSQSANHFTVQFEVDCRQTSPGEIVIVVGSTPELGNWDTSRGHKLDTSPDKYPTWSSQAPLHFSSGCEAVYYKFVVQQKDFSKPPKWEDAVGDRILYPRPGGEMTIWSAYDSMSMQ